jgi:hypothetical protein
MRPQHKTGAKQPQQIKGIGVLAHSPPARLDYIAAA